VCLAEETIVGGDFFLGVGGSGADASGVVLQHVFERTKINGARPYVFQVRKHFPIMFAHCKLLLQQVVNVVFHKHQFFLREYSPLRGLFFLTKIAVNFFVNYRQFLF
jgi:hypothetical protein